MSYVREKILSGKRNRNGILENINSLGVVEKKEIEKE